MPLTKVQKSSPTGTKRARLLGTRSYDIAIPTIKFKKIIKKQVLQPCAPVRHAPYATRDATPVQNHQQQGTQSCARLLNKLLWRHAMPLFKIKHHQNRYSNRARSEQAPLATCDATI
jgi:hypothetical protein